MQPNAARLILDRDDQRDEYIVLHAMQWSGRFEKLNTVLYEVLNRVRGQSLEVLQCLEVMG